GIDGASGGVVRSSAARKEQLDEPRVGRLTVGSPKKRREAAGRCAIVDRGASIEEEARGFDVPALRGLMERRAEESRARDRSALLDEELDRLRTAAERSPGERRQPTAEDRVRAFEGRKRKGRSVHIRAAIDEK